MFFICWVARIVQRELSKAQEGQTTSWLVDMEVDSNVSDFTPILGKISNLTSIFFRWVETTNKSLYSKESPTVGPTERTPGHLSVK